MNASLLAHPIDLDLLNKSGDKLELSGPPEIWVLRAEEQSPRTSPGILQAVWMNPPKGCPVYLCCLQESQQHLMISGIDKSKISVWTPDLHPSPGGDYIPTQPVPSLCLTQAWTPIDKDQGELRQPDNLRELSHWRLRNTLLRMED